MNRKPIIQLFLTFLIPFVVLLLLIPKFFNLELNNTGIGVLALGALFIMVLINLYRKAGHQGHLPIFLGTALLGLSGLALIFSVGINNIPQIIELDARSQGYALIGAGIGLVFLFVGLKQMMGASYFLGSIKRK